MRIVSCAFYVNANRVRKKYINLNEQISVSTIFHVLPRSGDVLIVVPMHFCAKRDARRIIKKQPQPTSGREEREREKNAERNNEIKL